jgi:CO/xanthine dehydrogenase Mo-binding subunit
MAISLKVNGTTRSVDAEPDTPLLYVYPILTMPDVPKVETVLIDRPDLPSLGAGEASQGPAAAALANAFAAATGRRIRDLPLTPERVRAVLA